ncbi:putative diguanylate cyclase DgcT [Mycolicibacterium vanbaalenii]|uniref:Putative diguanylate cyclase DgcT n=1 Tax=Mycolicibacterium vanbaalenii TaxID=110539 RepID=A0A5S9QZ01_MYCVN|nr:GGDEF domain-containing protein [Mycolicibacterium vanbaalenii]CAA0124314.1 putative diguanylate cyclase DgcT [Mycolicibacterium vanbaalenii]
MAAGQSPRWLQPSHYDWLSGYLRARGMTTPVRLMMALIAGSLALSLLVLLLSSDGPRGAVPVAMTWLAIGGGVAGVLLWAWRWPTQRQSQLFAVVSNGAIALACLAYPTPLASLNGCISFAIIGAYIAFFHSTALVLYNFFVAAGVAMAAAIRLATSGHPALAVVDLFLVLLINIAMPLAIQFLVRALGTDLVHAARDPLTTLLNRPAFFQATLELLAERDDTVHYLFVALLDLDNFKAVNDTHGHHVGDAALVTVARALPVAAGPTAVIGRSGGEEFLIATLAATPDTAPLAARICQTIAGLPVPITASVGTVCAPLTGVPTEDGDAHRLLTHLVIVADHAMYRAKRAGGNRFHHHGMLVTPADVTNTVMGSGPTPKL